MRAFVLCSLRWIAAAVCGFACVASGVAQSAEEGIPITDGLVRAKCGGCHAADTQGRLDRISSLRLTPEGWQDEVKRAIVLNGASLNAGEARAVVNSLSATLGLAPEESRPFLYEAERRVQDETALGDDNLRKACAKCHGLARAYSSRRTETEWQRLEKSHVQKYQAAANAEAIAYIAKAAPFATPEWTAWSAKDRSPQFIGRWLAVARVPGRGNYYGEMEVQQAGAANEFRTRIKLQSARDGTTILRSGPAVVYTGYAWRGRSQATVTPAPDASPGDLGKEAREVLWFAPDQARAEGRVFWGQYQEFGFDLELRRPSPDLSVIGVENGWMKIGSKGNLFRLIGDRFPADVSPKDLNLGPGVTVRKIVSYSAIDLIAEVDVDAKAAPAKHDLVFGSFRLPGALAIYDRIDYLKITPESCLAAFGDETRATGYQQFAAIAYQRGADGKRYTDDDIELGPIDVTWALKVFYSQDGASADLVGQISSGGLFIPASKSPGTNFDVWVIATAADEKDAGGKPLVGKSYMVVTVPYYVFKGRRYVRDLERWVDDGPAVAGAAQQMPAERTKP